MNLVSILILAFCAHNVFGQENVSYGDPAKSPRRLQDDGALNSYNNQGLSRQLVTVEDTPDEFIIKRPTKNDPTYDEFLTYLYRNDKAKSKSKREIKSMSDFAVNNDASRNKRMIIFRPLFVYKQQEVKRQRVEGENKRTKKPVKPTKQPNRG